MLKGLTSAIRILEKMPNAKITIYYKDKTPNTTSDLSAGRFKISKIYFD